MAFDLAGNFSRGLQAGQQFQQSRSMNRMRALMAGGIPTDTAARQQFVNQVAAEDPRLALDWNKHFAGMDANALEQRKAEAPFYVGALQGARDQSSYDQARSYLSAQGFDISDMPEAYDPSAVNMVLQGYKYASGLKPTAVPAGSTLYDPLTGEAAFTAPAKPATDTSAMKNAAALGLEPGTEAYNKFIRESALRPSTQINLGPSGIDYGDPPKDTAWARNADGTIATEKDATTGFQRPVALPITGTKGAREMEAEKKSEATREEARERQASVVLDEIDRIERIMTEATLPTTGLGAGTTASIPGTGAADISRLLDTVRANVGFDKLQQMREASPTGGALGQVSENENRLLQSVLGSLDQSLSEDEFRYNLRRLKDTFLDVVHGPGNRPTGRGAEGEGVTITLPPGVTEEDIEFTMEKHGLSREEVLRRLQ